MVEPFLQSFVIEGSNFYDAGKASTEIKLILKQLGIDSTVIRRVAIATYEAEMNVVMYAQHGILIVEVTPRTIRIVVNDLGPGIPDIELALKEGYSTATEKMREMGFGAGMGLPNIRKNSDEFRIESTVGKGTTVEFTVYIN
jgi:serine/threonine-protein kinase RsbT